MTAASTPLTVPVTATAVVAPPADPTVAVVAPAGLAVPGVVAPLTGLAVVASPAPPRVTVVVAPPGWPGGEGRDRPARPTVKVGVAARAHPTATPVPAPMVLATATAVVAPPAHPTATAVVAVPPASRP